MTLTNAYHFSLHDDDDKMAYVAVDADEVSAHATSLDNVR